MRVVNAMAQNTRSKKLQINNCDHFSTMRENFFHNYISGSFVNYEDYLHYLGRIGIEVESMVINRKHILS